MYLPADAGEGLRDVSFPVGLSRARAMCQPLPGSLKGRGQHVGTWEVEAMDLVEKSATIPSAKETGLDRAYCAHILERKQVPVSPSCHGHSPFCCTLGSVPF